MSRSKWALTLYGYSLLIKKFEILEENRARWSRWLTFWILEQDHPRIFIDESRVSTVDAIFGIETAQSATRSRQFGVLRGWWWINWRDRLRIDWCDRLNGLWWLRWWWRWWSHGVTTTNQRLTIAESTLTETQEKTILCRRWSLVVNLQQWWTRLEVNAIA